MRILASKVPAQVWADCIKKHSFMQSGLDGELYERWEQSKQVYRVDSGIWEMATVEDDTELPASALSLLPFDCMFMQHKRNFTAVDEFRSDGQEHRTEVTARCFGYFIVRGDGSIGFPADSLTVVPLFDGNGLVETKRLSDSGSVFDFYDADELKCPWVISLENSRTVGEVASEVRGDMCRELDDNYEDDYRDIVGLDGRADEAVMLSVLRARKRFAGEFAEQVGSVLGSLLYIISKGADVKTVYVPAKNRPGKSKQTDCTVHAVGFKVSRHLEKVRRVYAQEVSDANRVVDGEEEKGHRHVSPHVRRAHWHGYWLGPRDNPTELVIKWIAPVIVNGGGDELSGTVHLVDGEE